MNDWPSQQAAALALWLRIARPGQVLVIAL